MRPPDSEECGQALETTLHLCKNLDIPISEEKAEGSSTYINFIEIKADTRGRTVTAKGETKMDESSGGIIEEREYVLSGSFAH